MAVTRVCITLSPEGKRDLVAKSQLMHMNMSEYVELLIGLNIGDVDRAAIKKAKLQMIDRRSFSDEMPEVAPEYNKITDVDDSITKELQTTYAIEKDEADAIRRVNDSDKKILREHSMELIQQMVANMGVEPAEEVPKTEEPAEPTEPTEPTQAEPIEQPEQAEPDEEPTEQSDPVDMVESVEEPESVEPVEPKKKSKKKGKRPIPMSLN